MIRSPRVASANTIDAGTYAQPRHTTDTGASPTSRPGGFSRQVGRRVSGVRARLKKKACQRRWPYAIYATRRAATFWSRGHEDASRGEADHRAAEVQPF